LPEASFGFIYSDIILGKGEETIQFEKNLTQGYLRSLGKTDMTGLFRRTCWKEWIGHDKPDLPFKNLDLFYYNIASGNWSGYKMNYPAFFIP